MDPEYSGFPSAKSCTQPAHKESWVPDTLTTQLQYVRWSTDIKLYDAVIFVYVLMLLHLDSIYLQNCVY